jgi:hypothetical protein
MACETNHFPALLIQPCICVTIIDAFPLADFTAFALLRRLFTLPQRPLMHALRDHLIAIRNEIMMLAVAPSLLVVAHCVTVSSKIQRPAVHNLVTQGVFPLLEHDLFPIFWPALRLRLMLTQVIVLAMGEIALAMALRLQKVQPV